MHRRRFLAVTAFAGSSGLLAGCLTSDAATEDAPSDKSTTDDPPSTDTETMTDTDTPTDESTTNDEAIGDPTTTESGESEVGWTREGTRDGVAFEFTSSVPKCGQGTDMADAAFDEKDGTIHVTGVISGSDLCQRAQLADLAYDRDDGHLTVAVEAVDREDVEACAQCIADIPYEGTFSFDDDIPNELSVIHDGQGVMSAAYGSASASPPSETTTK